jgi:hypothetical protein
MSPHDDIEQTIREVNSTLAIEGMPLDKTDVENLRAVLSGDVSFREMKRRILSEYRREPYPHG